MATGFLEIFHAGAWGSLCQELPFLADRDAPARQVRPPHLSAQCKRRWVHNLLGTHRTDATDVSQMCDGSARAGFGSVACRQLGFNQGAFQPGFVQLPTPILLTDGVTRPAWVKSPECTGSEQSVGECGTLSYGDTETASGTPCWPGQLLRCTQ